MGFSRTCVCPCDFACVASSHFQKKRHFKYVITPFKISENMIEFSVRNFTEMLCVSYEVIIVASGTVTYTESGTPSYVELGQSISLSFLNQNGLNLVSRHIFSRCLELQNFNSRSLVEVLSKL